MSDALIFHLCRRAEWEAAQAAGLYRGSPQDAADGFIHFSTRSQIVESAAKHRGGEDDLVLVEVDATRLGDTLRWETSRGDQRFPHLYGPLPLSAVVRAATVRLGPDRRHVFPWGLGGSS
jgi:uncharacterized protein (DUF952 family)